MERIKMLLPRRGKGVDDYPVAAEMWAGLVPRCISLHARIVVLVSAHSVYLLFKI